jgi:hypothetical protein
MPISNNPRVCDSTPWSITQAVVPMADRCNNFLPVKKGNQLFRMANSIKTVTTKMAAPADENRRVEDILCNIA